MYAYHLPDVGFLCRFPMTGVNCILEVFHLLLLLLCGVCQYLLCYTFLIQLNVGQGEFYDGTLSLDYCVFLGMISDGIIISDPYYPIVISANNYYV